MMDSTCYSLTHTKLTIGTISLLSFRQIAFPERRRNLFENHMLLKPWLILSKAFDKFNEHGIKKTTGFGGAITT